MNKCLNVFVAQKSYKHLANKYIYVNKYSNIRIFAIH